MSNIQGLLNKIGVKVGAALFGVDNSTGGWVPIGVDQNGNLLTAGGTGLANNTISGTASSSGPQAGTLATAGYQSAQLTLGNTVAGSAFQVQFSGDGGTSWLACVMVGGNTTIFSSIIATTTPVNGAQTFTVMLPGPGLLRVNCSFSAAAVAWTLTVGTATAGAILANQNGAPWTVNATLQTGTNITGATVPSASPTTGTGATPFNFVTAGSAGLLTNVAQAVKASAGKLHSLTINNTNATAAFVQVFNAAFGSVTVGTTVPVLSFGLPATSSLDVTVPEVGIAFSTAISMAATTTAAGGTALATPLTVSGSFI